MARHFVDLDGGKSSIDVREHSATVEMAQVLRPSQKQTGGPRPNIHFQHVRHQVSQTEEVIGVYVEYLDVTFPGRPTSILLIR